MELRIWQPFDGVVRFHSRINDLFDQSLGRSRGSAGSAGSVWQPPVDVLESKDSYLVRAELAGMNKEDFNLEVKDGMLTLSGERKLEAPASGVEYRSVERVAGDSRDRSICRKP
jgi:HSP20 family protein